jgi:hypothetical protein
MGVHGEPPLVVALEHTLGNTLMGGDWASTASFSSISPGDPYTQFGNEVVRLARGDASSVDRAVASIRRAASQREGANPEIPRMATVLEAWGAVVKRAPDANVAVERADSAVRGWRLHEEAWSLIVGRAWAELGQFDRALVAIRRRHNALGFPQAIGLAEALRLEGKIASKAGDRSGAILAYEQYLLLRRDPEPVMKPQRDSVVAELAALRAQR